MVSAFPQHDNSKQRRVKGLDTLRFVLALWVVFGHFGFLPIPDSLYSDWAIRGVYRNLISGPAAVIVFFVISGFCIHWPYRVARRVDTLAFFAKRHIRIFIPWIVAIIVGGSYEILTLLNESIFWSLICEEIYYMVYPLLFRLRCRFGLTKMILVSFVLSFAVVFVAPTASDYPSYGPFLNWLLGLPCWLMGCKLAETIGTTLDKGVNVSRFHIWIWRLGAIMLSMICSLLRYHSPLGYPWTLNLFAIYAVFWIRNEVVRAERHGPAWLESGGVFSYSIYLMHVPVGVAWRSFEIALMGAYLDWFLRIAFIVFACYVFYLIIEQPAHKLARYVGNKILLWRERRLSDVGERHLEGNFRAA
jgi:peptidoglycan/LPS O-acetylase OafA/YrhL